MHSDIILSRIFIKISYTIFYNVTTLHLHLYVIVHDSSYNYVSALGNALHQRSNKLSRCDTSYAIYDGSSECREY